MVLVLGAVDQLDEDGEGGNLREDDALPAPSPWPVAVRVGADVELALVDLQRRHPVARDAWSMESTGLHVRHEGVMADISDGMVWWTDTHVQIMQEVRGRLVCVWRRATYRGSWSRGRRAPHQP